MSRFTGNFRRWRDRPHVRPWALAVPVLVILVCAPLLRPLRSPDPTTVCDDELARLLTVQSIVENRSMAIAPPAGREMKNLIVVDRQLYSNQPPVAALLLAGPYWLMARSGWSLESHAIMLPYLLTMIGVTLPVAGAAGLVYRMGRIFELRRPWRVLLATAVAFGSGLVSYATVLNAHAPAAALVLTSAACLIHTYTIARRQTAAVWLTLAGLCVALAGVVDVSALIFLPLFGIAILTLRWPISLRLGGTLLYAIGATPPLLLHVVLTTPLTGDALPGLFHPELAYGTHARTTPLSSEDIWFDDDQNSTWTALRHGLGRASNVAFGPHGVLSHYPILLLGALGTLMVMHRHWPTATKVLAASSVAGMLILVIVIGRSDPNWANAMFGIRWLIVAQPILLFWAGTWFRRSHRPLSWTLAGIAMAFSVCVTLVGATGAMPHGGFNGYTPTDALARLLFDHTTRTDASARTPTTAVAR
jgi:hypothetical protein